MNALDIYVIVFSDRQTLEVFMRKILSSVVVMLIILSMFIVGNGVHDVNAEEIFKLNAVAGNGVVRLWWDEVPGAKQGYYLYRGKESGGRYLAPLTDFGIVGNTYFDVNLENNTNYCYYCRAFDENTLSIAKSNEVCVSVRDDLPEFIKPCKLVLTFSIDSNEYLVNGFKKFMSTPCIIRNNRTFLLIRYVAEEIGGVVSWDSDERKVTVVYKDKTVEMWIGKSVARVNGVEKYIDPNNPRVVPFIENGRTHIPLRFPVESFGEGEVKWFASTKQAVLSFPGRCEETLEGVLTRYSSVSGLGQLIAFDGQSHLVANMNSLERGFMPVVGDCLRVTGRNDNADYPGYLFVSKAELIDCADDGVRYWNGAITKLDCANGVIYFDDEYGSPQIIRFTGTESLIEGYCHQLSVGVCISVSGRFSSSVDIIGMYIDPITIQRVDCPGQTVERGCSGDWYTGQVLSTDCISNTVVVEVDVSSRFTVNLPDSCDCTSIDPTWCVRFCATTTGTEALDADIFSAYPCDEEVCDGVVYSGRVISVSADTNTLKLSQEESYLEFNISGLDVKEFSDYSCAKVCAYLTSDAEGKSILVARSVVEVDCMNMCEGRIIQARVERMSSDCTELIVRTLDGDNQLNLIVEDESLCDLNINSCYEICLRPNVRCLCAISASPMECPIECWGMQVIGIIKEVKTASIVIQLYGSDKQYTVSVSSEQLVSIEKGMCVEACLMFELDGTSSLGWFRELDADKCGQQNEKTCDDLELIVHVKDVNCQINTLRIKIIDGFPMANGMEIDIPIDESIIECEELEEDTCMRVCGRLKGFSDFDLIWWEQLDPELCGISQEPLIECDEEVKGIVTYLGCREDDKIKLIVDNEAIDYISKDVDLCKGFEIGDCVLACLKIIEGAPPVILSMKKLGRSECPPAPDECIEEIVGRITDIGCTAYGYLKLNTSDGIKELTIRDYDVCEGFAIGECVKACIKRDSHEKLVVDSLETVDDGNCPVVIKRECDEYIKINLSQVFCEEGYIKGTEALTVEARTPMPLEIQFEDDSFCKMKSSRCYEVCYWTDDEGVLWGERFREVDCLGQSFCDGNEIDVKVISVNCKEEWIVVDYWNEVLKLSLNRLDCDGITPWQCLRVCISKNDSGSYTLDHYKLLGEWECPGIGCTDGRWVNGKVIAIDEYPDMGGYAFVMYGYSSPFLFKTTEKNAYPPFTEGDCIKGCAVFDPDSGMMSVINPVILPDDICGMDVIDGDIWKGTIYSINCQREVISIKRGGSIVGVRVSAELCTRFSEGDCIIAGGHWQSEKQLFVSQWFRHLPWEMCNAWCTGDEVYGSVVDIDAENSKIVLFTGENIIEFKSDIYIPDLKQGVCVNVCLDRWDEKISMYRASRLRIVDCIETPVCKENIIQGTVSDYTDDLFVWVSGNRYQVKGVSSQFQFKPGNCVQICGVFMGEESTYSPMPIYIDAEWVSVLPTDECMNGIDEITGVISDINELGQGVLETDNGIFDIHIPAKDVDSIDYPACVKAYGRMIPTRHLFAASEIKQIAPNECDWCDTDYMKAQLLSLNEEELFGFVVHDGFLERIQFNSYKILESSILLIPYVTYPVCIEVCGDRNEYDGVLNVSKMSIVKPSSCDTVCEGPSFTGTVKSIDHETGTMKLEYVRDLDIRYPEMLRIPQYIDFEVGRCVTVCTQPMNIWDTMVDMSWYPVVVWGEYISDESCVTHEPEPEPEPEPVETLPVWEGVITETYCIEDLLYCTFNDADYSVTVPSDIKCEQFSINDCVRVVGEYNEKYMIIEADKIEKIDCPKETETWDMIVFETFCDVRSEPYYLARAKTSFFDIYLPKKFKCNQYGPGDCITVKGTLEGKDSGIGTPMNGYIQATSIKPRKCEEYGPYNGIVNATYCNSRFIKVKYFDVEYDLYYPVDFKCESLNKGDCISFRGVIWTEGYIDAAWLEKTKCPRKGKNMIRYEYNTCIQTYSIRPLLAYCVTF